MTMTKAEKVVSRFLHTECASKDIGKYTLRHAASGKSGHDVESFDITEALDGDALDSLAGMIVNRAQMDADGMGPQIQRYTLTSFLRESGEATGRLSFRMKGAADIDLDGDEEGGEEPASLRGLVMQQMRINENLHRLLVQLTVQNAGTMARRLEKQEDTIEKLLDDRVSMFETVEAAKSAQADRDIALAQEMGKQERLQLGIQKVAPLIAALVDKISGGKIPAATDPTFHLVKELLASMSVPQLEAIRKGLTMEQQVAFVQLIQKVSASKQLAEGTSEKGEKEN